MSYRPERQFRATIIRGKAINDLDNLLPAYAQIISEICPIDYSHFCELFNEKLGHLLPESTKKTLDNHRTEIAGKLFGMYYVGKDGNVYCSQRTTAFISNNDQPFFFKDLCFKFQFPNGMDSVPNILEKIENRLSIRQFPYILKLVKLADERQVLLSKDEIGYYVLNSLEVLRGDVDPNVVLERILSDRESGVVNKVAYPGKASSYNMQHINEQLNLLELANLIRIAGSVVRINPLESLAIDYFLQYWNKKPEFDVYTYDLNNQDGRDSMYQDWDEYFAKLSEHALDKFITNIKALEFQETSEIEYKTPPASGQTTVELGDEGEVYVFQKEKERVASFDSRLVTKIKLFGKTKGLGYDILSVVGEPGELAEFAKYLEVKSTKRYTAPDLSSETWIDSVNITKNEWVASQQHQDFFYIYRVYFTSQGPFTFIIRNPHKKVSDNKITATPIVYRLDFRSNAIDGILEKSA